MELPLFSHFFFILLKGYEDLCQTVESLQLALNVSKVNQSLESVRLLASHSATLFDPFALFAALEQMSDKAREANHSRSLLLFLNSVPPLQTRTHLLKWCCNSLGIRKNEMWLPRSKR